MRDATNKENSRNRALLESNISGFTGVRRYIDGVRWVSSITVDRRNIHLGIYLTIEDAAQSRKQAEKKYGFHPNHGKPSDIRADQW